MSKKRKRVSRRRLAGQRVLAHVPTHNLDTGEHKPVTAARRYIAKSNRCRRLCERAPQRAHHRPLLLG